MQWRKCFGSEHTKRSWRQQNANFFRPTHWRSNRVELAALGQIRFYQRLRQPFEMMMRSSSGLSSLIGPSKEAVRTFKMCPWIQLNFRLQRDFCWARCTPGECSLHHLNLFPLIHLFPLTGSIADWSRKWRRSRRRERKIWVNWKKN